MCANFRIEEEAHQLVGHTKRHTTKIRPKAFGSGIFVSFPYFEKCWSEVVGDVISGVAVAYVSMGVRATFGKYGLNSGRIIWLLYPAGPVLCWTFCPVFNEILQPTGSN